ncbi:sugar phosphate isomerase/epimerase family protein [Dactylosporangium cerinum]
MIGLCSVTMRRHPVPDVVAVAAAAGLTAIEWAGDHHVPPSDPAAAAAAGARTRDAGLTVAAYGSYFRCDDPLAATGTVAAAVALGAPRIRVWAGATGSANASPQQRAAVAAAARRICDEAGGHGLTVAFECHRDTLTDTPASALALLAAVDRSNAAMYWQPPNDLPDAAAVGTLEALLPHVVAVHAFSWWPGTRPAAGRAGGPLARRGGAAAERHRRAARVRPRRRPGAHHAGGHRAATDPGTRSARVQNGSRRSRASSAAIMRALTATYSLAGSAASPSGPHSQASTWSTSTPSTAWTSPSSSNGEASSTASTRNTSSEMPHRRAGASRDRSGAGTRPGSRAASQTPHHAHAGSSAAETRWHRQQFSVTR